ncbi:hypothetical protein AFLA_008247 [Aspergillus flavus NRRL3357]|nr:hypothetical protein AFLA_008247 [Aspergillus flavus NRRL3357]
MDLANTLIRTVVRAFYETRHILVVDALFIHSVLHAEDLAFLLGMQQKDLRKLCAKLREDRLISVNTRAEIRDGSTRPVNREYYYIPLHPVIDAIKFKISKLTSTIKAQYTPSEERKEYICLRCGAEWTELDVLSLYSEEGFECQNSEEAARKAAVEKQNALPVWHTHSTVSTGAGSLNTVKTETDVDVKSEIKEEEDRKPDLDALDDKVAAYYAEMEREKALQAQEDSSSAEEDSDDFDEEFEDVGGVSASDTASPAIGGAGAGPTSAPTNTTSTGIKREFDTDSGTSAPQTASATPSATDEGPAAKRVKVEPEVKKEESDEDDDEEFEDV